ncbi:hypothetical protein HY492_03595 [Candidatus Woesearchaeota archaeon]|nr:hypothetical protein [Candidatus Woesearchaeota archaeon]
MSDWYEERITVPNVAVPPGSRSEIELAVVQQVIRCASKSVKGYSGFVALNEATPADPGRVDIVATVRVKTGVQIGNAYKSPLEPLC